MKQPREPVAVEFGEGAGVAPVAEAEAVVNGVAAEHGVEGVGEQADH